MKKKAIYLLTIVLSGMFLLSSCGGDDDNAVAKNELKRTLTVAVASDAGTFYPYYQLSGTGRMIYTPVYEALFFYDENTEPEPVLVDSYTIDEDNCGITMKLKEGIMFSDGTEMTSDDVLFSLDCILNSSYASNIGDIDRPGCISIDDYTVYFHFNSPVGTMLYNLCNLYVISKDHMESIDSDDWTYNCIGTGPFTWGNYIIGTEYQLVPNEYYREEKALDEIIIKIIAESSVQAIQLETGEIDLAMGLSYRDIQNYIENEEDGFTATKGPAIGSYGMWVNIHNTPYSDVRVRQAFAYAIDLEAINSIAFGGLAEPATNIFSSGTPVWQQASNLHTHDTQKAKQLLNDAGYSDGVTLDLYCLNSSVGQEIAEVMIASCAEAGITLNVTFSDFPTMIGYITAGREGYFLHLLYCNGDPYILLGTFSGELSSRSLGLSTSPEYAEANEILKNALQIVDDQERFVYYRQLMDISYDNCFTTPLIDVCDYGVHPENLHGFWMGGPAYHYEDCYWTE